MIALSRLKIEVIFSWLWAKAIAFYREGSVLARVELAFLNGGHPSKLLPSAATSSVTLMEGTGEAP